MEKEHVKAGYNKLAGKTKEEMGDATNDRSLQAKGKLQQAKAKAQDALGDVKDLVD